GTITLAAGAILIDNNTGFFASGNGDGGNISLVAQSIDIAEGIVGIDVHGGVNAGTVTISALGSNGELEVGFGAGQFQIDARGGTGGSQQGNGGTVALTAGRSMIVDPSALVAGPQGANGNGASLSFTVTNGAPCCGNLVVLGDLNVNATGQGA